MGLNVICLHIMGIIVIFAERALLPEGWANRVRIAVKDGRISAIQPDTDPQSGDRIVSAALPALSNLHSHAFQRAMAGLTEHRQGSQDSFWTWRQVMYRFLDHLTPDQIEAIAALAYMEMLEAGFAAVGEFHYLHHQPGGVPYDNLAELSARIFAAAQQTGIGLTHLPVLYSYGGAGQQDLADGQRRFGCDPDRFVSLMAAIDSDLRLMPADTTLGLAPHSLRATAPAELKSVIGLGASGPIHIHIAEQPREVAEISAWLGARPVEWLLENLAVGPNWCAIHATHMTSAETAALAKSGAVAGLCPITEANLGDGPFRGPDWLAAGGAFGIGTDSNVRISMTEELRTLEYSQRLRDLARNVMLPKDGSVGQFLYTAAAKGGAQAMGRMSGALCVGLWADIVAVDTGHAALFGLPVDRLLDGLVFAASDSVVTDVWAAGRHMVQDGRHRNRESILQRWRAVRSSLMDFA